MYIKTKFLLVTISVSLACVVKLGAYRCATALREARLILAARLVLATRLTACWAAARAWVLPTRLNAEMMRVMARDANVRPMLLCCSDMFKCSRAALSGCCRLKSCTRVHATMPSSHASAVHCMPKYSLHQHDQCQGADVFPPIGTEHANNGAPHHADTNNSCSPYAKHSTLKQPLDSAPEEDRNKA